MSIFNTYCEFGTEFVPCQIVSDLYVSYYPICVKMIKLLDEFGISSLPPPSKLETVCHTFTLFIIFVFITIKCIKLEIRTSVALVHPKTEHVAKNIDHWQIARPVSPRINRRADVSSLLPSSMSHHVVEEFRRDEETMRLQGATSEGRGSWKSGEASSL